MADEVTGTYGTARLWPDGKWYEVCPACEGQSTDCGMPDCEGGLLPVSDEQARYRLRPIDRRWAVMDSQTGHKMSEWATRAEAFVAIGYLVEKCRLTP